jgi:biopolymer transport protein ExbD
MILKRRKMSAEVPSMAMGDIAFLLLIFFIILARVTDDSHVKVNKATGEELEKPKSKRVSIAIEGTSALILRLFKIIEPCASGLSCRPRPQW